MKISANVLVENEESFVWFAVMSVIHYVDEMIIYDAGSVDNTPQILLRFKSMFPTKVRIKRIDKLSKSEYPKARQQMLEESRGDWILVLDGDEVWWDSAIEWVVNTITRNGSNIDSIVTRFTTCVGDMFHYQKENRGKYRIDGKEGHLTVRAINKHIHDLHVARDYGHEGFFSGDTLIQNLDSKRRIHQPTIGFMHLTHLVRSTTLSPKYRYERGLSYPLDYYYPEAFFKPRPEIVPYPFTPRTRNYTVHSVVVDVARDGLRFIRR